MASPPRSPPPPLRSSAVHVLCDPWLLRLISDFQVGLPLALYEFWVQHDPQTAWSTTPATMASHIQKLQQLVVTHGTEKMLELFTRVQYRDASASQPRRPYLWQIARLAIEHNRVDMVHWALDHKAIGHHYTYPPRYWWKDAIKSYRPNDFAVLELLNEHRPIDDERFKSECQHAIDGEVHLLKWIHEARPTVLASNVKSLVLGAVRRGDLEALRFLHERVSSDGISRQAFQLAYDTKRLDLLEYLLLQRPDCIDDSSESLQFQRRVVGDTSSEMRAFVESHAQFFRRGLSRRVELAAEQNDLHQLQQWHASGFLAQVAPVLIDTLVKPHMFPSIRFLHETGFATVTTHAMDQAALNRHWDVVDWLHEHRIGSCSSNAMAWTVERGNLARARFFHDHYNVVCPASSTAEVARDQPMELLRFLLEETAAECTTRVMDAAASNGRLHVVHYLHTTRSEGCTTDAIDKAATNGHLDVVEFLLQNRSEGFSRRAIEGALKKGHLTIAQLLFEHSPELFTPELLPSLLLRGAFDIYMTMRNAFPTKADNVLSKVMYLAGREMELPTVWFIINVLGRQDLAYRAVDGAVYWANATWLHALMILTGPGSCRRSAVRKVVATYAGYRSKAEWEFIAHVIQVCDDPKALETAIAVAKADHHVNMAELDKLERDFSADPLPLPALTDSMNPLLLDARTRSWVIRTIVKETFTSFDEQSDFCGPHNWATRAVFMRDVTLLQVLHDLPTAATEAFVRSSPPELEYSSPTPFSFEGARAASICRGDVEILQWLLTNIALPVEPTLLGEAVYYHQYEIAEWLVTHYPAACVDLDWSMKEVDSTHYDFGLRNGMLDWLEHHALVRDALSFAGIIDYTIRTNDIQSLRRLHGWYPELFVPRPSLLKQGSCELRQDTFAFLVEVGCDIRAVRDAIADQKRQWQTRLDFALFLVHACTDELVSDIIVAKSQCKNTSDNDAWLTLLDKNGVTSTHPLLLDPRTRRFALEAIAGGKVEGMDNVGQAETVLTWAVLAIRQRNQLVLQVIRDLSASTIDSYVDSMDFMYSSLRGTLIESFSFLGAREAAVRVGDLAILEWLDKTVDLPMEPTLLGDAIYFHHYEIAEWLVVKHPTACTELNWMSKATEPPSCDTGLSATLFDWLESHDHVRNALSFAGIIDFAVRRNDVPSLRRVYAWHPELFVPRPALLEALDRADCRDALAFLTAVGCDLSVVRDAIVAQKQHWQSIGFAPFVVHACSEGMMRELVIAKALLDKSGDESWLATLDKAAIATKHPLLLDPRSRRWAIDVLTGSEQHAMDQQELPPTWAVLAIQKRDPSLLDVLRDLPASTVHAYVESMGDEWRLPLSKSFTFQGAREAAVRVGDVSILEWLFNNVNVPVESTLLGEAVYYHHYEIAEWLATNHPAACTELDWTKKERVFRSRAFGLQDGLLDWLDAHPAVRAVVSFTGIIDFAARQNDVESLSRLYEWHPELFEPRPALIELADREDCSDVINFLLEIGWSADVFFGDED